MDSKFRVGQILAAKYDGRSGPETYKRLVRIDHISKTGTLTINGFNGVDPLAVRHGCYYSDDQSDVDEARKCGRKYHKFSVVER